MSEFPAPIQRLNSESHTAIPPRNWQRRADLGQYFTPKAIADFMASLFVRYPSEVKLLDPCSGLGSLTDAFVRRCVNQTCENVALKITGYELDRILCKQLAAHFDQLGGSQNGAGLSITTSLYCRDFITEGSLLSGFGLRPFTHVIKPAVQKDWREFVLSKIAAWHWHRNGKSIYRFSWTCGCAYDGSR